MPRSRSSSEGELAEFERLIEVPDRDLLAWITGEEAVPPDYDTALLRGLRDFHLGRRRQVRSWRNPPPICLSPGVR